MENKNDLKPEKVSFGEKFVNGVKDFGVNTVDYFKNLPANFVNFWKNWGKNFYNNFTSWHNAKEFILNNLLYILILLFVIFVSVKNVRFVSFNNIINIINQSFFYMPIALGIGGIIVLTGTDLSAGRVVGLTSCITASLLQASTYPNKMWGFDFGSLGAWWFIVVLLLVVAIGAIVGFVNGFLVSKFQLHPFIVTLGTQLIVYGLCLYFITLGANDGKPIGGIRDDFTEIITGPMFTIGNTRIQWYLLYVIILIFVMSFLWNRTKLGKNMFAVGCNPDAATVNGISVMKTTILVFVVAGAIYGFNGWISSAYVGSNNATTGQNFELDAIAACVIGGVSFTGGIGKIKGIVMGVFLLQIINAAFVFLGITPAMTFIVKGAIILFACAVDMRKYITRR